MKEGLERTVESSLLPWYYSVYHCQIIQTYLTNIADKMFSFILFENVMCEKKEFDTCLLNKHLKLIILISFTETYLKLKRLLFNCQSLLKLHINIQENYGSKLILPWAVKHYKKIYKLNKCTK